MSKEQKLLRIKTGYDQHTSPSLLRTTLNLLPKTRIPRSDTRIFGVRILECDAVDRAD